MSTLRHTLSREEGKNYPSPDFLGGFPVGFLSIVASKPGTGKTWYMLHNLYKYSNEARVGAIVGDCGPELIYDRTRRITNDVNHDNIYVYFLSDMQQAGYTIDLNTKEGLENLEKLIAKYELKMLYLDTLISLVTADESSQKEMTPIVTKLTQIAGRNHAAIILNHHLRKNSARGENAGQDIDEVIGSSILTRLASTVFTLKKKSHLEMQVSCVKNWFSDSASKYFRIIDNNGAIMLTEIATNGLTETDTKEATIREYVTSLATGTMIPVDTIFTTFQGLSMTTYRNVISVLEGAKVIQDKTPNDSFRDKIFVRT